MRKVTINTRGYIAPLFQDGPIVMPITIDDSTVLELVRRGYSVFEVNTNLNKKIQLTMSNINSQTRFSDASATPVPSIGTSINGIGTPVAPTTGSTTPIVQPVAVDTATAAVDTSKLTKAERKALRRAMNSNNEERPPVEVTGDVEIVEEATNETPTDNSDEEVAENA